MDARQNHPRLVQGPLARLFYGANTDTQILLNNKSGKATLGLLGIEGYKKNYINLTVAGIGCLESVKGCDVLEKYLTKYACKGG